MGDDSLAKLVLSILCVCKWLDKNPIHWLKCLFSAVCFVNNTDIILAFIFHAAHLVEHDSFCFLLRRCSHYVIDQNSMIQLELVIAVAS